MSCKRTISCFREPVTTASWIPDGSAFVLGSLDREHALTIWDTRDPRSSDRSDEPVYNFGDDCPRVQDCAICPASFKHEGYDAYGSITSARPMRIVTVCADEDKTLQVFDYQTRENLFKLSMKPQDITCISISRDCQNMLVNLKGDDILVMDTDTGEILQKLLGGKQNEFVIRSCFGGATESFIVSGGEGNDSTPKSKSPLTFADSRISIWHRHSGRLIYQLEGHRRGCINAVSWNPADPTLFASAGDDSRVRIWSKPISDERLMEIEEALAKQRASHASSGTPSAPSQGQSQPQGPPQWGSGGAGGGQGPGVALSPLLMRR